MSKLKSWWDGFRYRRLSFFIILITSIIILLWSLKPEQTDVLKTIQKDQIIESKVTDNDTTNIEPSVSDENNSKQLPAPTLDSDGNTDKSIETNISLGSDLETLKSTLTLNEVKVLPKQTLSSIFKLHGYKSQDLFKMIAVQGTTKPLDRINSGNIIIFGVDKNKKIHLLELKKGYFYLNDNGNYIYKTK